MACAACLNFALPHTPFGIFFLRQNGEKGKRTNQGFPQLSGWARCPKIAPPGGLGCMQITLNVSIHAVLQPMRQGFCRASCASGYRNFVMLWLSEAWPASRYRLE